VQINQEKKPETLNIAEFKALVNNLVPTTLKQAEWICSEVERLTEKYPELKNKLKEWYTMPESEKRELEEIINQILSEAKKAHQKR
jgi:hypothetical protein